ncbi:MAG: D-alanyl-D-alanine carboxypeptidase [Chloroflexi bacterium HGW-Chloroflexi-1]|nr:MAG: D-alanyl-D-alanine carboxypeptidase [Chloroflexi bacterium HGW-Chloroflexi-1]
MPCRTDRVSGRRWRDPLVSGRRSGAGSRRFLWRRIALVCLLVVGALGSLGFGPPVLTDSSYPPLRLDPDSVEALLRTRRHPAVTAVAATVVDIDANRTLYALRPHEPLPPASTVKVMTALLTLQRGSLTDSVTISAGAASAPGSRMGLVAGEVLTVEELLYGLLLPSGNDAAVALAEYVAGSETAFVALMNEAAAALDLTDTHFTNAHGLDDDAGTASAADLIVLARAALDYPAFARIVAMPQAYVAGRTLTNTNELLGLYPGADGVKTGTTSAAGECLIASATRDGHRLLVVVLGSQDRYADAVTLLDYGATGWRWGAVALPDNALTWEIGADGRSYRLRAAAAPDIFLPAWQWPLVQPVRLLDATMPLTSTFPVGRLRLMLDGQVLATTLLTVWQGP